MVEIAVAAALTRGHVRSLEARWRLWWVVVHCCGVVMGWKGDMIYGSGDVSDSSGAL